VQRPRRRAAAALPRLPHAERFAPAGFAALVAGWTAATLPFFPAGFPAGLALAAALLALWRGRAGLAFALAVPILPLGNVSLGLALLYSGIAAAWLALFWGDARSGLAFVFGPLLGFLGCIGLLPLAVATVRSPLRRASLAAAGIVTAALAAGFRHAGLPFTGERPPLGLGLAGAGSPAAVAGTLLRELGRHQVLFLECGVVAVAAAALPYARPLGLRGIVVFGAALLAATAALAPGLHALALAGTATVTTVTLAALERRGGKAAH